MKNPTFEDLPILVSQLIKDVNEVKSLLLATQEDKNSELELPITIDEVSRITSLTKSTLYKYCQDNRIPFYKKANRNFFFRSEIIDWIKESKSKTLFEIEKDAQKYLSVTRKRIF